MQLYSKHSKHLLAVDCIIFGYDLLEKDIKLLLIRRNFEPAKGKWSLAGGFVKKDESLDEAACRILCDLTGLKNIYMKQLYSYGDLERDCLLYTSDAADDLLCVDLGCRRIIKKKHNTATIHEIHTLKLYSAD